MEKGGWPLGTSKMTATTATPRPLGFPDGGLTHTAFCPHWGYRGVGRRAVEFEKSMEFSFMRPLGQI